MRRALAAAAFVVVALIATGCGRRSPDLSQGKALFAQKCGSCHVLDRAGTAGKVGPSLDAAFGPSRRDGLGSATIAGVVSAQIANPRRNSQMPAGLVSGDERRDVAAYVGAVAGVPGQDTGALAQAGLAGAKDGRSIFVAAGCGACHTFTGAGTKGNVGPVLDGLAAQAAKRKPGLSAPAYTQESILKPDAFVVKGFGKGIMPSNFGSRLTPAQVKTLTAFLLKTK